MCLDSLSLERLSIYKLINARLYTVVRKIFQRPVIASSTDLPRELRANISLENSTDGRSSRGFTIPPSQGRRKIGLSLLQPRFETTTKYIFPYGDTLLLPTKLSSHPAFFTSQRFSKKRKKKNLDRATHRSTISHPP